MSFFSQLSIIERLSCFLVFKALLIIVIILFAGIGLGPDEAQYWTWSQALDWSYYSKPPGIAWQIWLGTHLFGQNEWGVRSISVVLAFIQALAIYRLALYAGLLQRTAFWCSLFMAFSPLGIIGSFLAITDVGFLLCWTGACLSVIGSLHQKQVPNFLHIGCWILVGALFKWPMYLFWFFIISCRRTLFPNQTLSSLWSGILVSLAGLLPSIWWNWSHDWATFRHVFATVQGGSGHRASGNIGEFLGSQALLLSPILFILLLSALWQWFHQRKQLTPALYFCGFVTFTSLGLVTLLSCFQKIQGNWIIFIYPTALVILSWHVFQQSPARVLWAKTGLGLSLVLVTLLVFLPSFYFTKLTPFKHNIGWNRLTQVLTQCGYDPQKNYLMSDKYQTSSILSFYGPGQRRAYFLNLDGVRNNQFSYWPSLQIERKGQIGYFVWIESSPHLEKNWKAKLENYQSKLQSYFEKVEFIELAPLIYKDRKLAKAALIFRCYYCKEVELTQSSLY